MTADTAMATVVIETGLSAGTTERPTTHTGRWMMIAAGRAAGTVVMVLQEAAGVVVLHMIIIMRTLVTGKTGVGKSMDIEKATGTTGMNFTQTTAGKEVMLVVVLRLGMMVTSCLQGTALKANMNSQVAERGKLMNDLMSQIATNTIITHTDSSIVVCIEDHPG